MRPKPHGRRSRLAGPLLTSLGAVTLLAAGTSVVVGVSSTGSLRPWDWTRADPAAAATRYDLCRPHGLGALECMLGAGVRPASAASAPVPQTSRPLLSLATVQDGPGRVAAAAATPGRGRTTVSRPSPAVTPQQPGQAPALTPRPRPSGSEPDD